MPSTPGILNYPAALDDAVSLIEAANNASSTLTANISVGDLLIPVAQPGKFSNSGVATLTDSLTAPTKIEIFLYTSKSGNNLVVPSGGRGAHGTTAQAFSTGNFVEQRPVARHHTALADLLIAIEQKLGIGADTPGAAIEALMSNGAGASVWRALTGADVANVVRTDLAAAQAIISDLTIAKATPTLRWTHTGLSKNFIAVINGAGQLVIGEEGLSNAITVDPVTGLVTFEEVPLGPAANPPTANHLARREYVDTRKTWWSANWFIADPSTFPTNSFNLVQKVGIPSSNFTITELWVIYNSGSASGSFEITLATHPFGNQGGSGGIASINVNPGSVGVGIANNISDFTIPPANYLYPILTARNSPAQRDVTITAIGYQNPTS